jgi:hypothetical protein
MKFAVVAAKVRSPERELDGLHAGHISHGASIEPGRDDIECIGTIEEIDKYARNPLAGGPVVMQPKCVIRHNCLIQLDQKRLC